MKKVYLYVNKLVIHTEELSGYELVNRVIARKSE